MTLEWEEKLGPENQVGYVAHYDAYRYTIIPEDDNGGYSLFSWRGVGLSPDGEVVWAPSSGIELLSTGTDRLQEAKDMAESWAANPTAPQAKADPKI